MSNNFSLEKVLQMRKTQEFKMKDVIQHHYKKAKLKIKDAYDNYFEFCYYLVDNFVVKLPLYNPTEVAQELAKYMLSEGYDCKWMYDNKIYITWKPKERPKKHIPFIQNILEKKIEHFAKNNRDCLFYDIPLVIPEFPWYDANDATIEIARNISEKGFVVKVFKNVIYVSWKPEEIEKNKRVKIQFTTDEERRNEALKRINYINEQRYVDFINPKRSKFD